MATGTAAGTEEIFGVSDRWDTWIAVSVKITRVIFKCKNKQCKHVWAREYHRCYQSMGGPIGQGYLMRYEPARSELHRIEDGIEIEQMDDYICPKCHIAARGNVTANTVVGTKTAKGCDARCTGAKGHNCECSCGGKNHGVDYLV